MKKIVALVLFLSTALCSALYAAPQLPKKCMAFRPKKLGAIILTEKEADAFVKSGSFGQTDAPGRGQATYWDVYSDRENNTTYASPGVSTKFSSLKFNERVRIAQIQGNYALVYTEPKVGLQYPLISELAECKGWIPMNHLLLWQSCLANDRGIYNKALLCVNLEAKNLSGDLGAGYLSPDRSGKPIPLTTDMNFYFIMKQEKDMALLAIQNRVDGSMSDQVLYCWVPERSFVPWNQRSCLEPTWEREDVEYYAAKHEQVKIFATQSEALSQQGHAISFIPFEKRTSTRYDRYLYRMAPEHLRFPILDGTNDRAYNMSTFSTLGGQAQGTSTPTNEPTIDKLKEEKLRKMQRINLAVVIDGTSSMEPYYPKVKEALKEACDFFSRNYNLRIGVVIYRDYTDGTGLAEVLPMTSAQHNLERVNAFLDSGGTYGIRSSASDRTQEEALYNGINTALDKLAFRDGESNIMLIVGDCGNDVKDQRFSSRSLIDKLVQKDIHLMGFQVQNKGVAAYNNFNSQLLELMRESLKGKYHKLNEKIRVVARQTQSKSTGRTDGYNFEGNIEGDQLYICNHRFTDATVNGGVMSPEVLQSYMVKAISDFANTIQHQLDLIVKPINSLPVSGGGTTSKFVGRSSTPGMINVDYEFVVKALGGDAKLVQNLDQTNSILNFRGYALRRDASGRNYFKPVIFISAEEFQELLKRLAPVAEAARNSQVKDRTPYIEALKALVKSLAPGMTDAQMAALSNGDIMNMIAGLNESAEALKSYSLNDLSDPQAVSPGEYSRIINDFQKKYENLLRIRQSNSYKFVKKFNGAVYYWIPIEDLP
ncbi:type VI secretion system protein TssR domain-containing protein [Alistipes sp.]|uniref:type VI secretion system protein TssR domain-containing protein n=1 Tax=Alistipes sp. TaxID=1872444 RepID=UPI003A8793F7